MYELGGSDKTGETNPVSGRIPEECKKKSWDSGEWLRSAKYEGICSQSGSANQTVVFAEETETKGNRWFQSLLNSLLLWMKFDSKDEQNLVIYIMIYETIRGLSEWDHYVHIVCWLKNHLGVKWVRLNAFNSCFD